MPYLGNREPPLDEVLDDPIVRLVMARDRLPPEKVRDHVEAIRCRLREHREPARWIVRRYERAS